jgi:hypothetical protein
VGDGMFYVKNSLVFNNIQLFGWYLDADIKPFSAASK